MSQKSLTLQSIKLQNFKCHEDLTVVLSDIGVIIKGDNGTGKSSIGDALLWCLFGSDSLGQTAFDVKSSFVPQEATASITVDCTWNERPITFCRALEAKFDRQKQYKQHETQCYINGIPKGVREYEAAIAEICDSETFKLLTHTLFFNELIPDTKDEKAWQRRRRLLMQLTDGITDEDILRANLSLYQPIIDELPRYGTLSEYRKWHKTQLSQLTKERNDIPVKVEQQQKNIQQLPYTAKKVEKSKEEAKQQLHELKLQLSQSERITDTFDVDIYELKQALSELETRNQNHIFLSREQQRKEWEEATQSLRDRQTELRQQNIDLRNKITSQKSKLIAEYAILDRKLQDISKLIVLLVHDYNTINAEVFDTSSTVCPTCNREYEGIDSKAAQDLWQADKIRRLSEVSAKGKKAKADKAELEKQLADIQKQLDTLVYPEPPHELEEIETQLKANIFLPIEIPLPNYEEQKAYITAQIERTRLAKQEAIQSYQGKRDALQSDIDGLETDIKLYEGQLKDIEANDRAIAQMKELQDKAKVIISEYDRLTTISELLKQFVIEQAEQTTDKIHSHFNGTTFNLFKPNTTNDGLVEICEANYNGTPYRNLSYSEKMMCGIDIIRAFQKHYGLCLPIFIDNRESITLPKLNNQVILGERITQLCECGGETGYRQQNRLWKCQVCGNEFEKTLTVKGL